MKRTKAQRKREKCITKYCRGNRPIKLWRRVSASGKVVEYRTRLSLCWKCRSRLLKQRHPLTYVLNMLRHSARKRGLPFTLTKEQFREFCARTGYLEHRGTKPESLTVDRIDPAEGYHIWNIRVLTHADNSRRQHACPEPVCGVADGWEESDNPF